MCNIGRSCVCRPALMKANTPGSSFDDPDTLKIPQVGQGLGPGELVELMYGVAADMAAEGVPPEEINAACARVCERLGIDLKRFIH